MSSLKCWPHKLFFFMTLNNWGGASIQHPAKPSQSMPQGFGMGEWGLIRYFFPCFHEMLPWEGGNVTRQKLWNLKHDAGWLSMLWGMPTT